LGIKEERGMKNRLCKEAKAAEEKVEGSEIGLT
jgi:hypothetical protein